MLMSIDMATMALMGAVQALLMAVVLWTATGSYAGVARASLRLRALALEACVTCSSVGVDASPMNRRTAEMRSMAAGA